jgi:acetyl-CoA carboxylase beta subunit
MIVDRREMRDRIASILDVLMHHHEIAGDTSKALTTSTFAD